MAEVRLGLPFPPTGSWVPVLCVALALLKMVLDLQVFPQEVQYHGLHVAPSAAAIPGAEGREVEEALDPREGLDFMVNMQTLLMSKRLGEKSQGSIPQILKSGRACDRSVGSPCRPPGVWGGSVQAQRQVIQQRSRLSLR